MENIYEIIIKGQSFVKDVAFIKIFYSKLWWPFCLLEQCPFKPVEQNHLTNSWKRA